MELLVLNQIIEQYYEDISLEECFQEACRFISVYFILSYQERALDYLSTCIDQINTFNDILQLVIVELVYKVKKYLLVVLRIIKTLSEVRVLV